MILSLEFFKFMMNQFLNQLKILNLYFNENKSNIE